MYLSNSGVKDGSALCYKDGPRLPPLDFTTYCTGYGRYVIYYNERVNGDNYTQEYELENIVTELCEVIIKGTSMID